MDINNLLTNTANSIKAEMDLKTRSKQSIINSYLPDIETLCSHGVSYKQILESGRIPLATKHFYSLLHRARIRRSEQKIVPVSSSPQRQAQSCPQHVDLIEWKMIMPDISENLVHDLVKHGYSIQEVERWIREKQIPNSSALRRHFSAFLTQK